MLICVGLHVPVWKWWLASLQKICCSKRNKAFAWIQGLWWETRLRVHLLPLQLCCRHAFLVCWCVEYMRGFPSSDSFFHVFLCVLVCANLHFNLILLTLLHYLLDFNVGWSFSAPQLKVQPKICPNAKQPLWWAGRSAWMHDLLPSCCSHT